MSALDELNDQLYERAVRIDVLETALDDIRAKVAFEMAGPTGLERTCLSVIRWIADKALEGR